MADLVQFEELLHRIEALPVSASDRTHLRKLLEGTVEQLDGSKG